MQRLFKCSHKDCGEVFTNEQVCINHEKQHENGDIVLAYKLYVNEDCNIIMVSKCFVSKLIVGECFVKKDNYDSMRPTFYCYYEKANQQQDALKKLKEFIKKHLCFLHENINQRFEKVLKNLEQLQFEEME